MTLATWYWYTWPNAVTPEWILSHMTPVLYCLFMIIALRGLDMILYYYQTSGTPVLLNSCALELLYSWTPVTGRLLILYSWYYTPVDSRKPIIMNIICNNWTTYTGMRETDGYWYRFRVYGGHTNVVQLKLEILPEGHQVFPWGVLASLLLISCLVCHKRAYSYRSSDILFLFGHTISSGTERYILARYRILLNCYPGHAHDPF